MAWTKWLHSLQRMNVWVLCRSTRRCQRRWSSQRRTESPTVQASAHNHPGHLPPGHVKAGSSYVIMGAPKPGHAKAGSRSYVIMGEFDLARVVPLDGRKRAFHARRPPRGPEPMMHASRVSSSTWACGALRHMLKIARSKEIKRAFQKRTR